MKKLLSIFVVILFVGCGESKVNFEGKVFIHQTDAGNQIVGFDHENIYFKWDDDMGLESFNSAYSLEQVNDSTYRFKLETPNPYMENEYWEVVAKDENSFYTLESGKLYVIQK